MKKIVLKMSNGLDLEVYNIANNELPKYKGVYVWYNLKTKKGYIGVSSYGYSTLHRRGYKEHISKLRNGKVLDCNGKYTHFQKSFFKYGEKCFMVYPIIIDYDNNYTANYLGSVEKSLIALYETYNKRYGYNVSEGGEYGQNRFKGKTDKEMRLIGSKISKSKKGKTLSDEHITNISNALRLSDKKKKDKRLGSDNPFYGKSHSKSAKEKLSEANKGINNPQSKKCEYTYKGVSNVDCIKTISELADVSYSTLLRNLKTNNGYYTYKIGKNKGKEFRVID